jgi:hypothetical protein
MHILEAVTILGAGIVLLGFAAAFVCARKRVAYFTARIRRLEGQTARNGERLRKLESREPA